MAADAVFAYVMPKIKEFVLHNTDNMCKITETADRIEQELESLQSDVIKADRKRTTDAVRVESNWIRKVRSLMFSIEDALDWFIIHRHKENMKEMSCTSFLDPVYRSVELLKLTFELEKLDKRIQQINSIRDSKSNEDAVLIWNPISSETNFSAWDDVSEDVIGFDKVDVTDDFLFDEHDKNIRRVLFVFGDVGVGKTTFVRKSYYAEWIRKVFEFQPCIWLDVMKGDRVDEVLYQILASLLGSGTLELGEISMDDIKRCIFEKLEGRRYFIVLDGISSRLHWDYLESFLPRGSGCVIPIVRCEYDVFGGLDTFARSNSLGMNDSYSHIRMSCLGEDDCYELLSRKLFGSRELPPEFSQVSKRELLDASGGNPLGILLLSGILRCHLSVSHWKKVLNHLGSYNDNVKPLERILTLALDDLPIHLRPCFLYLAFLPNSKVFSAEKLCRLWIAEGFVPEQRGKRFEGIAESYLQELVFRRLIRVTSKAGGNYIKEVIVHEAVLEFVRAEASKAEFLERYDNQAYPNLTRARRAVLYYAEDQHANFANTIPDSSVLRSIFGFFFEEHPRPELKPINLDFLKKVKFLRVLEIISPNLCYLPDEIGDLINLAYIRLRSVNLTQLPSTIAKLVYLQTLDIGGTRVRSVTEDFWQHVTHFRNFIGLVSVPEWIGALYRVHAIDTFDFTTWNQNWEMFAPLSKLRILSLCGIKEDHMDSLLSLLQIFSNLRELKLEGEFLPLEIFQLSALSKLQSLELKGPLCGRCGRLDLPWLEYVAISNSGLTPHFIWLLSELKNLTNMEMNNCFVLGEMGIQIEPALPEIGFHVL